MMSFLTYITGFFMNFELLPILTDYEIKKKSSTLKLLSQSQPNFAEMIEEKIFFLFHPPFF
jgi:hypothetical protein